MQAIDGPEYRFLSSCGSHNKNQGQAEKRLGGTSTCVESMTKGRKTNSVGLLGEKYEIVEKDCACIAAQPNEKVILYSNLATLLCLFTDLTLSAEDETNDDDGAKADAKDATVANTANMEYILLETNMANVLACNNLLSDRD